MSAARGVREATVFAPGTIGNVGPGFDVLGLCIEGIGDKVTVQLTDGPSEILDVTGMDAADIPREPEKNVASIAALAYLRARGATENVRVTLHKGLPLGGGLGGSAASSVGGALAAALALGEEPDQQALVLAAIQGEEAATGGRHFDNIIPCIHGGLGLIISTDPVLTVGVPLHLDWYITVVTPLIRIATRDARVLLPEKSPRAEWVQQMGHTSGLIVALLAGNAAMATLSLVDQFAEPRRAHLIPHFAKVKAAAMRAGAIGGSISGAGPTVFMLSETKDVASRCASEMCKAFGEVKSVAHVGRISSEGARAI